MYVSCHRHLFLVLLLNQRWSPPLRLQASHCSTFHIMCDVLSIAVFCSESIECFPGIVSKFFFKLLVTIPVAPIIIIIIIICFTGINISKLICRRTNWITPLKFCHNRKKSQKRCLLQSSKLPNVSAPRCINSCYECLDLQALYFNSNNFGMQQLCVGFVTWVSIRKQFCSVRTFGSLFARLLRTHRI